jgi:hypothetical protein
VSAYDTILAALHDAGMKVKDNGRTARAQCRTHDSTGLTLSIRRGDDRARVKCFAYCDTADVLADLGLELKHLYDNPTARPLEVRVRERSAWEEACRTIAITDEKGNTSHPVIDVPDLDHVLDRMVYEQAKEAAQEVAGECVHCFTRPSPWTCSCGFTRLEIPVGSGRA